jgi:hypothetical protein
VEFLYRKDRMALRDFRYFDLHGFFILREADNGR